MTMLQVVVLLLSVLIIVFGIYKIRSHDFNDSYFGTDSSRQIGYIFLLIALIMIGFVGFDFLKDHMIEISVRPR